MNILATSITLFALSTPVYLNKINPVRRGIPSQYINLTMSFIFIISSIQAKHMVILDLQSIRTVRNKRHLFSINLNDEKNESFRLLTRAVV